MAKAQTSTKLSLDDLKAVRTNIELVREFCAAGVSQEKIRLAATALRLLVTNDGLGKAWRTVGFEKSPKIISDDYTDKDHTFFGAAITCFDTTPEAPYSNPYGPTMMAIITPDGEFKEMPLQRVGGTIFLHGTESFYKDLQEGLPLGWSQSISMTLEEFRKGCIIKFANILIPRNKVVKYVANVRGSAHLHGEKQSNKDEDDIYAALDQISESHHTFDRDTVFAALMTIGQHVTGAPDIINLEDEIGKALPIESRRR